MFSRIFIERPRLAMVVSLVLVLTGIISLFKNELNSFCISLKEFRQNLMADE